MAQWLCRPKEQGLSDMMLALGFPYGNRNGTLIEADMAETALQKLGPWWQQCVAEGWAEVVVQADGL